MTRTSLAMYLATAILAALVLISTVAIAADMTRAAMVLNGLAPARAAAAANQPPAQLAQKLEAYVGQMKMAWGMADPVKRATAIEAARANLSLGANRDLSQAAIQRIDSLLELPPAPPNLGTVR